jgi:hypothetical protein
MFKANLYNLLQIWKAAGDKVLLPGDFNKDVYSGEFSTYISGKEFRMTELCLRITGTKLPSTHLCRRMPIDGLFLAAGLECTAVTLLPSREGIGDHRAFIFDINSDTLLGDPRVFPVTQCLLNCNSNQIRQNYIFNLNQLLHRHCIFKKLLELDKDSDHISIAQLQLRMNKVDLEFEQFMKLAEKRLSQE